jgi:hypothetical protein
VQTSLIWKRIGCWGALLLGGAGVVACAMAIYEIWIVRAKVSQRTEVTFARIDDLLVAVKERVGKASERIGHARITLQDLEEALKSWSRREARERLAARLDIAGKADRVSAALADADHWLEVSASSLALARQALQIGNAAGASMDTEPIDRLHETVESWRAELAQAAELAARVRDGVAGTDDAPSLRERFEQALKLALRMVATLSSLGDRLEHFETRVSEVRGRVDQFKFRTLRWILTAAIGSTVLIAWMAAGQATLALLGWRGVRR